MTEYRKILTPRYVSQVPAPWQYILPGTGAALSWLHDQGWGPGTRLGLGLCQTPNSAALLQAAILRGCIVILFQRRLHVAELQRQLDAAQAHALVADTEHPLFTSNQHASVPITALPTWNTDDMLDGTLVSHLPETAAALVLASSGTTGEARFIRLSRRALAHSTHASCQRLSVNVRDTWLACLPLDHIGGAGIIVRSLTSGCAINIMERFDAATVSEHIDAGSTVVSLVPTMLHRLVEYRSSRAWPKTLRCLLIGGSSLSTELIARCTALGLAPSQTYGLTEAASQVCTLDPDSASHHSGTAGTPLDGMNVDIRDGHIWIRGPSLFDGYEHRGTITTPHSADAWFETGDLGTLDEHGYLTVLGRHDDLIISGGENIYPAEVESVLEQHPGIMSAGVYGLPHAEWGQLVAAILVPRSLPIPDADIEAFLLAHLSRFKRPRQWRWMKTLPTTASGKLRRAHLATWS